jgi:hypothetical protein
MGISAIRRQRTGFSAMRNPEMVWALSTACETQHANHVECPGGNPPSSVGSYQQKEDMLTRRLKAGGRQGQQGRGREPPLSLLG